MTSDRKNDLVEVFAGSPIDAEIVNGLLKDAEIDSFLKDENMGTIAPWHVAAGGLGAVKIVISSEDYDMAKQVIEKYEQSKK